MNVVCYMLFEDNWQALQASVKTVVAILLCIYLPTVSKFSSSSSGSSRSLSNVEEGR